MAPQVRCHGRYDSQERPEADDDDVPRGGVARYHISDSVRNNCVLQTQSGRRVGGQVGEEWEGRWDRWEGRVGGLH